MNKLFVGLLLLSFIVLVIGLIKPSAIKMASRARVGLVFGSALIVFLFLVSITSPQTDNSQASVPTAQSASSAPAIVTSKTTTAAATPIPAAPTKAVNATVAPTASQPTPAAQPTVLVQLKGSGTKSSQTFTAPSNWTLSYTYDCSNFDGDSGNFQVFVQSADGSFNDLSPVNELGASGSDTEYYHSGGQFYLEVNSECDWTVTAKG